ncbi:hypothetical protein ABIE32_002739 [Comamonas sp. 4034]
MGGPVSARPSLVRAAGPYEFSNPAGGTVSDTQVPYANPAPTLTVSNTSGGRIKITSNGNASETGTCAVNAELAPGASCTTQAYACTPPDPVVQPIAVLAPPDVGCNYDTKIGTYPRISTSPELGSWHAYPPVLSTPPSFDIAGATITSSYARNATQAIYDQNGSITNVTELTTGIFTVEATAPAGYGFGANLSPSMTWDLPYDCATQDPIVLP